MRAASIIGLYPLIGALATLTGWFAGSKPLTDWDGDGVAQMPNNAIAFIFAGVALLCGASGKLRAMRALAAVCGAIGLATLFEHLTSINLGIDTLVITPAWGAGTVSPGRMGVPASVALSCIGASLLCLTFAKTRRWAVRGGLFVIAIAMLSIIGYFFGASPLFSIPRLTTIALQTSTMTLALGVALVVSVSELAPMRFLIGESAATPVVRRGLPLVIIAPLLLGWLLIGAQSAGYFDTAFGTSLLVLILIALLVWLLLWSASTISVHEAAMRQSRDGLADILGSITDPFVTFDQEWRFVFVNKEAELLIGKTQEELRGKLIWDTLPAAEARGNLRLAMTERVSVDYEVFYPRLQRWLLNRAYPLASGGLAVHARDITERRKAEEALRASAEALLAADRMKDEFLATLSHELRTPLTSIIGWSQMLLNGRLEPGEQALALEAIRTSARAQAQLIEDVLDVSRIVTGKMRLERQETDLAALIVAAIATVRPAAEARRIEIRLALDRTLPPILLDPERIQQVVWNLLSNAIKFSPESSAIDVILRGEGATHIIEVADQGQGIAAEFLPYVFDRFRQADSSSARSHAGLGIGLALAKDLVQLHGGIISVESTEGRGSRFTVRLPAPAERRAHDDERRDSVQSSSLAGVRVLYVDDRADARALIASMLKQHGADVTQAASVDDALTAMNSAPPDVIVTDLAMPIRDGFNLLATLRADARWQRLPVLALTAQGRIDDEARAATAGFQAFLRKPIESQDLAAAVARAVSAQDAIR